MSKLEIKYQKIDELYPYVNNPRDNDLAVEKVAESIDKFGFKVPIIVDKANEIIAGHTRVKACKLLGIEEVPTIVADDLSEDQVKAFRLADNKVSEFSDWDYEILMAELKNIEMDMQGFGFESVDDEIDLEALGDLFGAVEEEKEQKVKTCPHCGKEI